VSEDSIRIDNPFAPPRAVVADAAPDRETVQVLASRGSRFIATVIDWGVFFLLLLLANAVWRWGMAQAGEYLDLVFYVVPASWLGLAAANVLMLWRSGQTVGKRLLGLRVVRVDGQRVNFPRLFFIRFLLPTLAICVPSMITDSDLPFLAPWAAWALDALFIFGAARQCLHDKLAKTKVVTAESSLRATRAGSRTLTLRPAA
jgi:uncharacterized RDD family membrane protein YckC